MSRDLLRWFLVGVVGGTVGVAEYVFLVALHDLRKKRK